jgi:hypothetical protein
MSVDRHRDSRLLALLYRSADRFRPEALCYPAEIVAECEQYKSGGEDRDPCQGHAEKPRCRLTARHQRPQDKHNRHQEIDAAEHQVVGHHEAISSPS